MGDEDVGSVGGDLRGSRFRPLAVGYVRLWPSDPLGRADILTARLRIFAHLRGLTLEGLGGTAAMIESIVGVWVASGKWCSGSGCEVGVVGELAEGSLVGAGCGAQAGRRGWVGVGEFGQPGVQQVIVSVGEEQGVL